VGPERSEWDGELAANRGPSRVVVLDSIVEINNRTSSGAFKATAAEAGRWWVKPLNNPCGPRIPITELIVGKAGALINAPVCEVAVVEIPPELEGEVYGHGRQLEHGYAVGSRDVPGVIEERELKYRQLDDNRRRQAGIFALYDWCWGSDAQWLYASEADQRTHSHDHGYYLPGRPCWTAADLRAEVDTPRQGPWSPTALDPEALDGYADRLDGLTREDIRSILDPVPPEWPVTQHELETVGWFLERRATQVAERLRRLAMQTTGGQEE